ncbi:hypothetical protein DFH06DRAFT_976326 [Mycena polygramma]|nr:hypothetical protein DFH06DRAFT_976326 [Mycena polygramma]
MTHRSRPAQDRDPVHSFLVHAGQILHEAQFIIDSFPNVEIFSVERALRQLHAVHYVLTNLEDEWLAQKDRGWRDVRKDTLQVFREIFIHLEETGLLDMESPIDRVCLYIVFQPRIQASLDETLTSWNLHKMRTANNKTPHAIYELSREKAINRGYWTGDPGDDLAMASDPSYGVDSNEPLPPVDELAQDTDAPDYTEFADATAERDAGVYLNDDNEVEEMKRALGDFDYMADDENWGIDVYCRAVLLATEHFSGVDEDE